MKTLITGFSLAAISAVVTTTAFAQSGPGVTRTNNVAVQAQEQTSASAAPKSREQVRAELVAAYSAQGTVKAL
jgi:hypothetical protein